MKIIKISHILIITIPIIFMESGIKFAFSQDLIEQIVEANDRDLNDRFGRSMSLKENRAIIGADSDDENGNSSGAAYIFEKTPDGWIETAKLIANDGDEGDLFGRSVSLSGNTALVGAVFEQDVPDAGSIGSAYIFNFEDKIWSQATKLQADDETPGNRFGENVSLSGDRALISATGDNENIGAVYVFDLVDGMWQQSAKLTAPVPDNTDSFGRSISLIGDRAVVGSNGDGATIGDNTGAVFVYDLIDGVWTESEKLIADDGQDGDQFGASVSLDEDRILVGATGFDNPTPGSTCPFVPFMGAAYVFDLENNSWIQTAKIFDEEEGCGFDVFGESVSLYGDQAVIGADGVGDLGISAGAAYLFKLSNGTWTKVEKILASNGTSNDKFGGNVSLYKNDFLIAASAKDDNSGTAYLYSIDSIFANGFE
ncbi:MAG: FG-GAP repeat protein [Marinicellaceae bacterium]